MSKILALFLSFMVLGCAAPQLAQKGPLVPVPQAPQPCLQFAPPPDRPLKVVSHEAMQLRDPVSGEIVKAPDGSLLYAFITSEIEFDSYFRTCNGSTPNCGYIMALQKWAAGAWAKCGPKQVEVK